MGSDERVTLALMGDVMTGRGIDQILPRPCDPVLHEPYITSAAAYVELAEERADPIPRGVAFDYVWGDVPDELDRRRPHLLIANLETALTTSDRPDPGKGIHYRTSPDNAAVLRAGRIQACSLANNHVLDWGPRGLEETLDTLDTLGIRQAGAGRTAAEAAGPAILPLNDGGRVLLFARGFSTAGVPSAWAAEEGRPGVAFLPHPSRKAATRLAREVREARRPGDLVVISLHWGPNWGYGVSREERAFARTLVDEGAADLIHGHSSHHPRPFEVHGHRPVLYGCGDFLNDYEGIGGHEAFRPELVALWIATFRRSDGWLLDLILVPFRVRRFRLERAGADDAGWLREVLVDEGRTLGTRLELQDDEAGPVVRWSGPAGE